MSNEQTAPLVPFEPDNATDAGRLANWLAKSSLVPEALKNRPADILTVVIMGHELGIRPMQAIRSMNVIKGKAVMSAGLMTGLVLRAKDTCEYFRLVDSTDKRAVYVTKRKGSEPVKMEYTWAMAGTAGLTNKDNYRRHPAAMLRARCSSALARAVYPDLTEGIYLEDEADAISYDELPPGAKDPEPVHVAAELELEEPSTEMDPIVEEEEAPVHHEGRWAGVYEGLHLVGVRRGVEHRTGMDATQGSDRRSGGRHARPGV
jgi:hypothetical protein